MPFNQGLFAEIKTPNYDFSLSTIEPFLPEKKLDDIQKDKTIQSEIYEDLGSTKVWKVKVKKPNFHLVIFVQVKNDVIVDSFIRMPQHFNHDQILKQLRDKFQKHDRYVVKDKSALYSWMNKNNMNILYHGSCSISCFPIFIEFVNNDKKVIPLYTKFNEALPKW